MKIRFPALPLFAVALALALVSAAALDAQEVVRSIPSLSEGGEALAVVDVAPRSGLVTFARSPGRGILVAGNAAESRALSFVDGYGKWFGAGKTQMKILRAQKADAIGIEHVHLQQMHRGIPVRGGELAVHLRGSRVVVANGHLVNDLPEDITPRIAASAARVQAEQAIQKYRPKLANRATYTEPQLEIFNRGLLTEPGKHPSRLAWFIEAKGGVLREFIWIDAQNGNVLLHFNQTPSAKTRKVYTAAHTDTLPGTLVRTEGEAPTGDTDQDDAYTYAGITYDYYLTNHNLDSFDRFGVEINSTAHYCEDDCPNYPNAFWSHNHAQLVYGDGFASADDVVAHEYTHAVIEYNTPLLYYMQSGALNESFADIMGETVDLTDGVGDDSPAVRWLIAEDLPTGAIRDMMNPNLFDNPSKMSDSANFWCSTDAWTNPNEDDGGVHVNSGIPNHAYALMVDGGTFNGRTVTGIGLTKAAKIQFRALTAYLTSSSGFIDNYNALNQSCTDLIGTAGITSGDCTEVDDALLAVEMNAPWGCPGAVQAPALCPSGIPSFSQFDGFESGPGHWTEGGANLGFWSITFGGAHEGVISEWGRDDHLVSDHSLTLTNAVTIPAAGRFYFDHMFEFENDANGTWDGAVLEYSTNGGSSWLDAASLIDAGKTYNGTVETGYNNPLALKPAFVGASFGYTGTRLNLASLAGSNLKLRFRIGTDESFGGLGWLVDNPAFYTCVSSAFTDDPLSLFSTIVKKAHITELRTRIDSIRIRNSLLPFSWTDPTITIMSTPIRAVHVTELRTALGQAYAAAGITAPTYTDPGLAIGTTLRKAHIAELRLAVLALE